MFHDYKTAVMAHRVDAGARWLDGYFGRDGWLGTINTQRLDLANGNTCMIGQMFQGINDRLRDNFQAIIARGILSKEQAVARGFLLPRKAFLPWTPTNELYAELTTLWVEKLGALKQEAARGQLSPIQVADVTPEKKESLLTRLFKKQSTDATRQ